MKVFLDTNVILDLLLQNRDPQDVERADILLEFGKRNELDLYMSALTIPTVAYVLKCKTPEQKKQILLSLTRYITLLPSLPEHVSRVLEGPMKDIEDALQVESAKEGLCDIIVTRDKRDFKDIDIPCVTPKELLDLLLE